MPALYKGQAQRFICESDTIMTSNSMRNVSSKGKQEQMDAQAVLLATARVEMLMGSTRV